MYCCYCLVFRSHPILCNPMDYSLPGSSSIEFPMQEYWSGLPFPSAGALPDPGIKPRSPALQAVSCIGKWVLYPLSYLAGPKILIEKFKLNNHI